MKQKKSPVKPFDALPLSEYEKTLPLPNDDSDPNAQIFNAISYIEQIAKELGIKTIAMITTVGAFDYLLNRDGDMVGNFKERDDLYTLLHDKQLDGAIIIFTHQKQVGNKQVVFFNVAIVDCGGFKFTMLTPCSVELSQLTVVMQTTANAMKATEEIYKARLIGALDDISGKTALVGSLRPDLQWLTNQIVDDFNNMASALDRNQTAQAKSAFYYLQ